MVSHTTANIQQFAFARGLEVSHASLEQMSHAVHLVAVHVGPAFVGVGQRVKGVDIAVRPLRLLNQVGPLVQFFFHRFVGMYDKAVGHAFHRFIHVGVIKIDARVCTIVFSGVDEVLNASCLILNLVDAYRQSGSCMMWTCEKLMCAHCCDGSMAASCALAVKDCVVRKTISVINRMHELVFLIILQFSVRCRCGG